MDNMLETLEPVTDEELPPFADELAPEPVEVTVPVQEVAEPPKKRRRKAKPKPVEPEHISYTDAKREITKFRDLIELINGQIASLPKDKKDLVEPFNAVVGYLEHQAKEIALKSYGL